MEWPKKIFFLCIYAIAGVSSPNCGDKVEVQLLFMAFFIYICYMAARLRKIEANLDAYNFQITTFLKKILDNHPDKEMEDLCGSFPDSGITFETEFSDNVIERIKLKLEIVKNQLSCLDKKSNYPAILIKKVQKHLDKMSNEIINFTSSLPHVNGGRRRKSRKKRGKGLVSSKMRKKHMSARQPKQKYVDDAIKILKNDQSYLIADRVERGRRVRNLALQLEDDAKKGGRRRRKSRRKSRRKTKKRRKSKRRKSRRKRR